MLSVGDKVTYAGKKFQNLYDKESGLPEIGEVVSFADKNPNKPVVDFKGESYMLPLKAIRPV